MVLSQLLLDLQKAEVGKVREKEPLANHTTMKIGGPADILVEPANITKLEETMKIIKKHGSKWRAVGRGSNLLVSDKGIEGVVIKLGAGMDHLEIKDGIVTVGGGYPLVKLVTVVSKQGLSGLEFAGGIPGSVGGAVFMNAGAHGSDISKVLIRAHILFEDGTMEWVNNGQLHFSYRTSVLQTIRPGICLEAVFQLEQKDRKMVVDQLQKNKNYRRETQPFSYPSCGSVFRNPLPNYAGQLIEEAGLKGYVVGGAQISEQHANFIINKNNAKAQDVLDIIQHVKKTILEKRGIEMKTEVEIIGRN
ncbi:UDP-N-acetylmuramate dehydrogenase [Sutcliffiella cohnii]|uniref:UDP-N-acetylmuramate dehydrogenase n=1 Tax=Sutcliffiella cohnii TaxID=33932 RepID=UPI002E1DBB87|nr:UDP-N-acetylmuramate dehydrogenase [Sutcliffiella cohnii]MED4015428.1 UDP-N-acetylmuramate dehydrogenase [Sutcliffiella cohnii]